jgi:divalent metal cation (Fe/Co/Zn/Cd) transporter
MSRLEMNEQWQNLNVFSYKIALLSSINVIPSYFILSKRVSKKQIERQFPNGKGKFITTIIPSRKRIKLAKDVKLKHAAMSASAQQIIIESGPEIQSPMLHSKAISSTERMIVRSSSF